MKVFITGVAGFLGSHLAVQHLSKGDIVFGVDNFSSSSPKSEHLSLLKSNPRFFFLKADISRNGPGGLGAALNDFLASELGGQIGKIYNFACPASPPIYQRLPVQTTLTCTSGVANVLDIAREHSSVVVHASTSEVYGDPEVSPQQESYRGCVNPYGPRSCYDEGKRAAEALCYDYLNTHNVDVRLVRIFNTYGPHMDPHDGRVVSNFICQALRGEDITVYGEGKQTRSFCYVDDLIRGIVSLGELSHNPGTPINIGNPGEFTVLRLAELVSQMIPGSGNIIHKPLPKDDPLQRRPHIKIANEILGWSPQIQLEEGLERTIAYFRNELERRERKW